MVKKIYSQQQVTSPSAGSGSQSDQGSFFYTGFNSRRPKAGFREYDIDLIKQDLLNHFHIKRGEKLLNPEFGTIIWEMIYEPMTEENVELIKQDIETIVSRDPRTNVSNVKIDSSEHGIRIEIDLQYIQSNQSETLSLTFNRTE
jgi:phage baseplate assembly protein W